MWWWNISLFLSIHYYNNWKSVLFLVLWREFFHDNHAAYQFKLSLTGGFGACSDVPQWSLGKSPGKYHLLGTYKAVESIFKTKVYNVNIFHWRDNDLQQYLPSSSQLLRCSDSLLCACVQHRFDKKTATDALKLFLTSKRKLHEVTRQPWSLGSFAFQKAWIGGQESAFLKKNEKGILDEKWCRFVDDFFLRLLHADH